MDRQTASQPDASSSTSNLLRKLLGLGQFSIWCKPTAE